jgi:hypothetical protein
MSHNKSTSDSPFSLFKPEIPDQTHRHLSNTDEDPLDHWIRQNIEKMDETKVNVKEKIENNDMTVVIEIQDQRIITKLESTIGRSDNPEFEMRMKILQSLGALLVLGKYSNATTYSGKSLRFEAGKVFHSTLLLMADVITAGQMIAIAMALRDIKINIFSRSTISVNKDYKKVIVQIGADTSLIYSRVEFSFNTNQSATNLSSVIEFEKSNHTFRHFMVHFKVDRESFHNNLIYNELIKQVVEISRAPDMVDDLIFIANRRNIFDLRKKEIKRESVDMIRNELKKNEDKLELNQLLDDGFHVIDRRDIEDAINEQPKGIRTKSYAESLYDALFTVTNWFYSKVYIKDDEPLK